MVSCLRPHATDQVDAVSSEESHNLVDIIGSFVARHGPVRDAVFTTFTCDAELIARDLIPVLGGRPDGAPPHVWVICDGRHYRGHAGGPWMLTWPGTELFHPKIAWLVADAATLLVVGSGNLTPAGQYTNREILACTTWSEAVCPAGLVPLIKRMAADYPRLHWPQHPLVDSPAVLIPGFLRSRRGLTGLLPRRGVDRLVVVSPFYDRDQGDVEPDALLDELVAQCRPERLDVVVPSRSSGDRIEIPLTRAQLDRLTTRFGGHLRLFGIPVGPRPLHAKAIFALRARRAVAIIGSANATRVAFQGGNIEAVVCERGPRALVDTKLRQLLTQAPILDPATVRCRPASAQLDAEPPRRWAEVAFWDAATERLEIRWRRTGHRGLRVRLDQQALHLDEHGQPRERVRLCDRWYLILDRPGQAGRQWVPILCTNDAPGPRWNVPEVTAPPEAWLTVFDRTMTSPGDEHDGDGPQIGRRGRRRRATDSDCSLAERCRLLQAFLGSAIRILARRSHADDSDRTRVAGMLVEAARHHDPATAANAGDRHWYIWVRCEIHRLMRRRDCWAPGWQRYAAILAELLEETPTESSTLREALR